jgi:hypothetical protein
VRFAVPDDGECVCVIGNGEVEHLFVSLTDAERLAFVRKHADVDEDDDLDSDEQPGLTLLAS